jgi:pimeloyl-ACP methyl ester carboxylesterase
VFKNITLDEQFEVKHIKYFTPEKGVKMAGFARALSTQIDTTEKFVLVGVSLGGMLATEMAEFLNPEKTILISSAKSRFEFPGRYKFQRSVPLYKIIPPALVKGGAKFLQPIVEPDRNFDKETFKSMLSDKDPIFLKRTVTMILEWERIDYSKDIIHIHGNKDHTLPYENIDCDYLVENGSHMMVLTRAENISGLLNRILSE